MPKKEIDTEKISKAAKKVETKGMPKIQGGKVISKALSEAKKTKKEDIKPKDTYVEHSDHTNTYTKHTKHGKSW